MNDGGNITPRVSMLKPEEMNAAQRRVHDAVVVGRRGRIIGPLRAVLHSPDLATKWSDLGEFVRYSTSIPKHLSEIAILATGRRWNSQLEFLIHREDALAAGVSPDCIEAIRTCTAPQFQGIEEYDVYEFARELLDTGTVSASVHQCVRDRWDQRGVVELTAIIGYYSMVCLMLNANLVPLPEGSTPPLDETEDGLSELSAAARPS